MSPTHAPNGELPRNRFPLPKYVTGAAPIVTTVTIHPTVIQRRPQVKIQSIQPSATVVYDTTTALRERLMEKDEQIAELKRQMNDERSADARRMEEVDAERSRSQMVNDEQGRTIKELESKLADALTRQQMKISSPSTKLAQIQRTNKNLECRLKSATLQLDEQKEKYKRILNVKKLKRSMCVQCETMASSNREKIAEWKAKYLAMLGNVRAMQAKRSVDVQLASDRIRELEQQQAVHPDSIMVPMPATSTDSHSAKSPIDQRNATIVRLLRDGMLINPEVYNQMTEVYGSMPMMANLMEMMPWPNGEIGDEELIDNENDLLNVTDVE